VSKPLVAAADARSVRQLRMELMKYALLTVLWLASPDGVRAQSADSLLLQCGFMAGATGCVYDVSIIQLLARPEVYNGKQVRLKGYIHLEFEGNGIYLHREDQQRSLYSNGLWVGFKHDAKIPRECQDRYVLVVGTFAAADRGHMSLWGGSVNDIFRCVPWG
jgi:hypothetical protein